jgi:hypothetical protein
MIISLLIVVLVAYLYWDYKYSRASKVLRQLKDSEPVLYKTIYGVSYFPPSIVISDITNQGIYLKIQSKDIKNEIVSIDHKHSMKSLWPYALFIGFVFLSLIMRAISNG